MESNRHGVHCPKCKSTELTEVIQIVFERGMLGHTLIKYRCPCGNELRLEFDPGKVLTDQRPNEKKGE